MSGARTAYLLGVISVEYAGWPARIRDLANRPRDRAQR